MSRGLKALTSRYLKMNIFDVYPAQYTQLLTEKAAIITNQFAPLKIPEIEVFDSPVENYRMRAEFTIYHEGSKNSVGDAHYCMFDWPQVDPAAAEEAAAAEEQQEAVEEAEQDPSKKTKLEDGTAAEAAPNQKLSKREKRKLRKKMEKLAPAAPKKERVRIDKLPRAATRINELMPQVLEAVNGSEALGHKLFQVNYLTTLDGSALVTMIYHKKLEEEWISQAKALKERLNCDIVGRSRKQQVHVDRNFVVEKLSVAGRELVYKQVEGSFSQPNGRICEKMLEWTLEVTKSIGGDLLELYCGNGNFGIALAPNFNKVLGTEISKISVEAAAYNIEQNKAENVVIGAMSAEDFSQAMKEKASIKTKAAGDVPSTSIDLSQYDFSTVLVDPPRAGLDDETCKMVSAYKNIVYVSCNPETLRSNLDVLSETHTVERFAVFDQFPYTAHLECGALLVAKADTSQ